MLEMERKHKEKQVQLAISKQDSSLLNKETASQSTQHVSKRQKKQMNKITLKKIDNDDKDGIDDDQMTDDEQLVHQQKQCLKELRISIEAFIGKQQKQ